MKSKFKKIIAIFLCLCMCVSLLPVIPATAAVSEGELEGHSGWVFEYEPVTMKTVDGFKLIISSYNVDYAAGYFFRLHFDTDVVSLAKRTDGSPLDGPSLAAYNIKNITQSMIVGADAEVYGVTTNTPIQGTNASPFNRLTFALDSEQEGGKGKGYLKFDLATDAATMVQDVYDTDTANDKPYDIRFPINEKVEIAELFFVPVAGKTMSDVNETVFHLYTTDPSAPKGYNFLKTGPVEVETVKDPLWFNFPKAPETTRPVTFTVKADQVALPGAVLSFTGASAGGTDISGDYIAQADRTTGADGTVTVNLPDSKAVSDYKLKVADCVMNGTTYTMSNSSKGGFAFEVGETKTTHTYTGMEEVTAAYPVVVKTFDAAGNPVGLKGAPSPVLQFGQSASPMTVAAENINENTANFTTATSGDGLVMRLSGVKGFQNIIGDTAKVNVRPQAGSVDKATLSVGDVTNANAKITDEIDGSTQYFKVVLKQTLTNVTVPIPVPTADGQPIKVDQAKAMQVSFVPNEKASDLLKKEVGAEGVVLSGNDITVTPAISRAEAAGSIQVEAPLPDGPYNMSIGGNGFDAVTLPVTVLTDRTTNPVTRIVNVGGLPTITGGKVAAVAGGVTASKQTAEDESGNANISLLGGNSDTNIVEGGNTTVDGNGKVTLPEAGVGDVTDKSNSGLLDTGMAENMTPVAVTDPMYTVEVAVNKVGGAISGMTADVYLVNANASAGTFGMYFDPVVFDTASMAAGNITLNSALGIEYAGANSQYANPEVKAPANVSEDGYITFAWGLGSGNTSVNATGQKQKIATIQLPVRSAYQLEANLAKVMDNRSIYTMEYQLTDNGKKVIVDAAGDQEVLNQSMGATWRTLDNTTGAAGSVHLDDSKATRGGFYQISAPVQGGTRSALHDIRMQFTLPDFVTQQRADFFVTGRNGDGAIQNAEIQIYDEAYTPALTPVATLTTNGDGRAHAALKPDADYFYTVTQASRWAYPDGTAQTDTDGLDCDSFALTVNGPSPKTNVVLQPDGSRVPTAVVAGYVNPQMDIKSFHMVSLLDDSETPKAPEADITSSGHAYNDVDYTFTITPNPGYEWKLADGETMADVAGALSGKLYTVSAEVGDGHFQQEPSTPLTVAWDDKSEQFVIDGKGITGNPIGEVSGQPTIDPLRAGNIVITIPNSRLQFANSTITATAGTGGKVSAALDTNENADHSTLKDAVVATADPITETLSQGRTTSSIYTFTPDNGNVIDKVVINGAELKIAEEQKKNSFTYQFADIAGDQSIYVTFANAETGEPASDPAVTLVVGAKGSVAVTTGQDALNGQVTGPATKQFILTDPASFEGVITPAEGYEIDTVLIDNIAQELTKNEQGFVKTHTVNGLDLTKGATHTVAVTFKLEGGPSTQAIVTAAVTNGSGVLAPVGVRIYPVKSTPTYTMKPAEQWTIDTAAKAESIIIDKTTDESAKAVKEAAGDNYTYTFAPLTGNTTIDVNFSEVKHEVQGQILTQAVGNDDTVIAPATLIFSREAIAAKTDATKLTITSDDKIVKSGGGNLLKFTADIPAGKWTVTVKKQGYVDYEIKDFIVSEEAAHIIYFGDNTGDGGKVESTADQMKAVPLIAGDAGGEGLSVAFDDVSMVIAGWVNGALPDNKVMSDVNESNFLSGGGSDTSDMALVKNNISKRRVRQDYTAFCGI